MYLLDTNVISELRQDRGRRTSARVAAWIGAQEPGLLYLSIVVVLELEMGVLRKEQSDPAQGAVLRRWLEGYVLPSFGGRILPVDVQVARRCAALHVPVTQPYGDALIAATAEVHGMIVVTRNVADFLPTGVAVFNPWEHLAG